MNKFPPEMIYVLLFAVILLFQYLKGRFARRVEEQEEAAQEERPVQLPEVVRKAPPAFPVFTSASSHWGRTEAPRAPAPRRQRRFSRSLLLGTRRRVQNAVVVAAILGRCRAFEPHDIG